MKTSSEVEAEFGHKERLELDDWEQKATARIEKFMEAAGPRGISGDWYEGSDERERTAIRNFVILYLAQYDWRGTFSTSREQMYNIFSGESAGCGIRTTLTVVPR